MKSLTVLFILSLLISGAFACEDHKHGSAELKQVLSDETVLTKSAAVKNPGAVTPAAADAEDLMLQDTADTAAENTLGNGKHLSEE